MPILDLFTLALVGLAGGLFGSILGLGGGIFVVPLLVLVLGLPTHTAIGTSIVTVIATSSAAAAIYAKARLTNIRLGMLLETATTIGGVIGAFIAGWLNPYLLNGLFSALLLYTAYTMLRRHEEEGLPGDESLPVAHKALANSYYEESTRKIVRYGVSHIPLGMVASAFAGGVSGLLGIGGGIIKVPVMNLFMGVPLKAAIATSNFMIGVTAVASAFIYYQRGDVHPLIVAPMVVGVILGAQLGARLARRIQGLVLRRLFTIVLFIMAVLMLLRAANLALPL